MTRRAVAIFVLAAAAYGAGTHAGVFSAGNDASRWAQVEALVDYGTPSIESSRFRATVDRVLLDGREYSNKPPLLAFTAAALYAPLRAVTGWRLADPRSGGRVIRGVVEGGADPQTFIPELIGHYRDGRFPFDRLIKTYPFTDILTAIADGEEGRVVKPVLLMPE